MPSPLKDPLLLLSRLLVSLLFLGGAAQKIVDPGPVQDMIASIGLPGWVIWPVATFNLFGGVALLAGWRLAVVCPALAIYCLGTTWFHWQLRADPWQVTIIVKNISTAGGLLALAAAGPGRWRISA